MSRVYNFSAGPSCLPEEVLQQAAAEMLDYKGTGMSVMEMSHRSKPYQAIIDETEALARELMGIPENYKVLFLQGGASLQFAMIPQNLIVNHKRAAFMNTGAWSDKAIKEAKKFGEALVVASSKESTFNYIPEIPAIPENIDYFYICANNTIYGTKFNEFPQTGNVPLIADFSSCIMSEKVDVSKFGLIFAGAQKNLGPAGVCLVIIRDDLVGKAPESTPTMLNYQTHVDNGSMFNTPPTYGIYIMGLVFQWIKKNGGIEAMEKRNREKAALLYDFLDSSSMFKGTVVAKDRSLMNVPFVTGNEELETVVAKDRSLMNVPFVTGNEELDAAFIKEATAAGFVNLKGHRSVGGMRASIYNAMPLKGVQALVDFMKAFEAKNK